MPVIYSGDIPYYPSYLSLETLWYCPLAAGGGLTVDLRCVVYDSDYAILETHDLNGIKVKDEGTYYYDWAANKFSEEGGGNIGTIVLIGLGVSILLATLVTKKI
jgi:hypothetical protein